MLVWLDWEITILPHKNAALKKLLWCQIVCYSFASVATSLCCYIPELQETSEQAQSKFKSEKQSRRQLELKATALEEELTDLRAEKESLERVNSTTEAFLLNASGQEPLLNKHFNFSFKDYNRMCSLWQNTNRTEKYILPVFDLMH